MFSFTTYGITLKSWHTLFNKAKECGNEARTTWRMQARHSHICYEIENVFYMLNARRAACSSARIRIKRRVRDSSRNKLCKAQQQHQRHNNSSAIAECRPFINVAYRFMIIVLCAPRTKQKGHVSAGFPFAPFPRTRVHVSHTYRTRQRWWRCGHVGPPTTICCTSASSFYLHVAFFVVATDEIT